MKSLFFNADDSILEGIARSYRRSSLTNTTYINLTQCETLEGITSHSPHSLPLKSKAGFT
jgi:hypothetical protein